MNSLLRAASLCGPFPRRATIAAAAMPAEAAVQRIEVAIIVATSSSPGPNDHIVRRPTLRCAPKMVLERSRWVKLRPLRNSEHDDFELGWLLDRDVARLCPAQNLVDVVGGAPEQVREACSIGHQVARFNLLPEAVHGWQSRGRRQDVDADTVGAEERVARNIKCLRAVLERLEGGRDILRSPNGR